MGMDVYGLNPMTEDGKYFRNSVWGWHPLANYIQKVAPKIAANCKYWHSNDGDGLDAMDARALADVLRQELSSGRTLKYETQYTAELEAMPDLTCEYCDGTGTRGDAVGVSMGFIDKVCDATDRLGPHPRAGQKGWCNGCNGTGKVRPFETHYPFSVENVENFLRFLDLCGGFRID